MNSRFDAFDDDQHDGFVDSGFDARDGFIGPWGYALWFEEPSGDYMLTRFDPADGTSLWTVNVSSIRGVSAIRRNCCLAITLDGDAVLNYVTGSNSVLMRLSQEDGSTVWLEEGDASSTSVYWGQGVAVDGLTGDVVLNRARYTAAGDELWNEVATINIGYTLRAVSTDHLGHNVVFSENGNVARYDKDDGSLVQFIASPYSFSTYPDSHDMWCGGENFAQVLAERPVLPPPSTANVQTYIFQYDFTTGSASILSNGHPASIIEGILSHGAGEAQGKMTIANSTSAARYSNAIQNIGTVMPDAFMGALAHALGDVFLGVETTTSAATPYNLRRLTGGDLTMAAWQVFLGSSNAQVMGLAVRE